MNRIGWKIGALAAGVLAAFAMLYGWLPWWIDGARLRDLSPKDQAGLLGSDRGDVLKMAAGFGAAVALVYTALRHILDRKAHALSEQGQVTDRYTKAITQLASDKLSERIGGIYALERIMADSVRDHPIVVEVLAAFVRQHASLTAVSGRERESPASAPEGERPDADVQAAMTVLARRPDRDEPFMLDLRRTALARFELPDGARLAEANLFGADLSRAFLSGANLSGAILLGANLDHAVLSRATLTGAKLGRARLTQADLEKAILTDADLNRANLTKANLTSATLTQADLFGANLTEAFLEHGDLTEAVLNQATLTEAYLGGATLTRAYLGGTTLTGTDLGGATLTGATELGASQLAGALLDESTNLDSSLAEDAWVRARIEACKQRAFGEPVPAPTPEPTPSPQ